MTHGSEEKTLILSSEAETLDFGRTIAQFLRLGDIVKIIGNLGAGKTTLVKGIVAGLGGNLQDVHSPTFSIVHEYKSPIGLINHCDFYRLPAGSSLQELGGWEFFDEAKLYLLEWPENIELESLVNSRPLIKVHLQNDSSGRVVVFPALWRFAAK